MRQLPSSDQASGRWWRMKVLVACEFSGIVRDAFARRGHDAWSCDLLPSEQPGQHIQGDVFTSVPGLVQMDGQSRRREFDR